MRVYRFQLSISSQEYLSYYQGAASSVVVEMAGGFTMQFPAVNLRPFVTQKGIHGEFVMRVDDENKLQSIKRAED